MNATPMDPTGHPDPIEKLKSHVAAMSELAVSMVADATRALLAADLALATSVTERDESLDKFDVDLEAETIRLIATLQPEGPDLRTLGAVLKIANCVDRIGRLGYDIARNVSTTPAPSDRTPLELLQRMDERARAMVRESIDAFVQNDANRAKQVFVMDDEVDATYQEVQGLLVALLSQGGAPTKQLAHALLVARHLERVADNACKIAEKAVYAITGERRNEYFPALAHREAHNRTRGPYA